MHARGVRDSLRSENASPLIYLRYNQITFNKIHTVKSITSIEFERFSGNILLATRVVTIFEDRSLVVYYCSKMKKIMAFKIDLQD